MNLSEKKIAVLMGGPGNERPVSLASGAGVAAALRTLGAEVFEVDVTDANFVVPAGTEIAFNVIHGTFGEDGQLQRILEKRGLSYTGEGVAVSEVTIDKIRTKERFQQRGVPTPASEILRDGAAPTLPLPYVVKAPKEGSSVGVYVVKDAASVEETLREAWKFGRELLVEQYVAGRELTIGILGTQALPIIEIRPKNSDEFYDFANKYNFLNPQAAGADHFCPAALSEVVTRRVQEVALAASRAVDLEVYGRVDVLLDAHDQPFVLEINTIPGMTPVSLLPEAAAAAGLSYAELCARVIELSLAARGRA